MQMSWSRLWHKSLAQEFGTWASQRNEVSFAVTDESLFWLYVATRATFQSVNPSEGLSVVYQTLSD